MKLFSHYFLLIMALSTAVYPPLYSFPPHVLYQNPANHYQLYIWGYYNQLEGNYPTSQECYSILFQSEVSYHAYQGYLHFLLLTRNYAAIVQLIPKVDVLFPDNVELQLICAKALEQNGNQEEADKKVIALTQKYKNNPELIYHAVNAHVRNHQLDQALTLIDDYLVKSNHRNSSFIFYYLKAHIYLGVYNKDLAIENIKKCLDLNPHFDQGWLFSGLIHEVAGNIDEALVGYTNFLQLVGSDYNVEQQIIKLTMKRNQSKVIHEDHTLLQQAVNAYTNKNYRYALDLTEKYLQQQPSDQAARLLKIEILCANQQKKEAVNLLTTWAIEEPAQECWLRALHLLYLAQIEQESIEKAFDHIITKNNIYLPILYHADILLKKKSFEQALQKLEKALVMIENQDLREKVLYQIATIHHDTPNKEKLKKTVQQLESMRPNFAPALNLLAYYYATTGNNLTKATTYIQKALLLNKENVHFLDTQAVIWYKQQQYKKAYSMLQDLHTKAPHDYFILKHLGKTLLKLGNHQQALGILKQAQGCATGPEKEKCNALITRTTLVTSH